MKNFADLKASWTQRQKMIGDAYEKMMTGDRMLTEGWIEYQQLTHGESPTDVSDRVKSVKPAKAPSKPPSIMMYDLGNAPAFPFPASPKKNLNGPVTKRADTAANSFACRVQPNADGSYTKSDRVGVLAVYDNLPLLVDKRRFRAYYNITLNQLRDWRSALQTFQDSTDKSSTDKPRNMKSMYPERDAKSAEKALKVVIAATKNGGITTNGVKKAIGRPWEITFRVLTQLKDQGKITRGDVHNGATYNWTVAK